MRERRALGALLICSTLLVACVDGASESVVGTSSARLSVAAARSVEDSKPQVLAISIDALNPAALRQLGRERAPHLWRLIDEGAATLNARTQVEMTVTLPNHTSMVTSRRIDRRRGGHGVTWNTDRPGTSVQVAARHGVASVFSVVHGAGRSTALFAAKTKFSLFARSWPKGIDRVAIVEAGDGELAADARRDLLTADRAFTFLHLGGADQAGHAHGFLGPQYLAALRRIDGLIGKILHAADAKSALDDLTIILTADHGGSPGLRDHGVPTDPANYTIPFAVWGPGITPADLYALNPTYRDPGDRRPTHAVRRQPVRNGVLANLATDLLELPVVPGSAQNADHSLVVSAAP
ncbi:MAG: alkaline phosphatase family protein [Nocardioides sp.]